MAQISKGFTYTATSPNNLVTYTNLNQLADAATLLPGAVTDQTTKATPLSGDALLLHSAADTALRKTTVAQLFTSGQSASFSDLISTAPIPVTSGGTGVNGTMANGQLLIGNGTGFTKATLTAGSNVTITNTAGGITIAASGGGGGSGTVTSVNASGGSTGLSFSGGPVTSSGTLTLAGTLAVANGGTGSTSASTARTALGLGSISTANITVSTSSPTGGSDGDVWFKY